MGDITIFFKDGHVIGSCPVGHEQEWVQPGKGRESQSYNSTKRSTDECWHNWARARVHVSEEIAQREL